MRIPRPQSLNGLILVGFGLVALPAVLIFLQLVLGFDNLAALKSTMSDALCRMATGGGLSYRWQKNGVDLSDGGGISGATTESQNLKAVWPIDAAAEAAQALIEQVAAPAL